MLDTIEPGSRGRKFKKKISVSLILRQTSIIVYTCHGSAMCSLIHNDAL